MGEDISNQSERSDSFCGQREGRLLVSVLPPSWSTDLFPKTKSFSLAYSEALFVNLGSMEKSKGSRNASFSTPGWGKVSFPVRTDGLNT